MLPNYSYLFRAYDIRTYSMTGPLLLFDHGHRRNDEETKGNEKGGGWGGGGGRKLKGLSE